MRGRDFNQRIAEFGEWVHFKKLNTRGREKDIFNGWRERVFIGTIDQSGEHMIGTYDGVLKVLSIIHI